MIYFLLSSLTIASPSLLPGSSIHDADGDGYVTIGSTQVSVPMFDGGPMDATFANSIAQSESETLVAWGTVDRTGDLDLADGLLWMVTHDGSEATARVLMDRTLDIGAVQYGGYLTLTRLRAESATVSTSPTDWLGHTAPTWVGYHTALELEMPAGSGDTSATCLTATADSGTMSMRVFDTLEERLAWEDQSSGSQASIGGAFSWLFWLFGCPDEPECQDGLPETCAHDAMEMFCETQANQQGMKSCGCKQTGMPGDGMLACEQECRLVPKDESCTGSGSPGGNVPPPAEYLPTP